MIDPTKAYDIQTHDDFIDNLLAKLTQTGISFYAEPWPDAEWKVFVKQEHAQLLEIAQSHSEREA